MQQGSQIKSLFIDSKRGIYECTDYKLRRRFIGLDAFFKSGQPSLPLFSSPDKRLRPQLGLIKARCLSQVSFNFNQGCPLC